MCCFVCCNQVVEEVMVETVTQTLRSSSHPELLDLGLHRSLTMVDVCDEPMPGA